ncbi:MAG: hypothetical protein AAGF72_05905 [Pseudomonadota bacterium]
MERLLSICLLLIPLGAAAQISGPTSSSGTFTLQWGTTSQLVLREVDSSGTILDLHIGGSQTFTRSPGTYYFEEWWCGYLPYPFDEFRCVFIDDHQTFVSTGGPGGSNYPQSIREQTDYEYRIRSGDFDFNGRTDVFVERVTGGPQDGSMQSYIVWNNSNGSISTGAATGTYGQRARSAPINTVLNLLQSDVNADGFADHIIERVDQVMGSGYEQELAVYAPGTAQNKTVPQGSAQVTENFRSYFVELARWMNNENYFAENINNLFIPIFAYGYSCRQGYWYDSIFGFVDGGYCAPYVYFAGFRQVQYGVNFSSLSTSTHMDRAANAGTTPSENDLWQISQVARSVIGVHLFGFDINGNRWTTNNGGDDDAENRFNAFQAFVYFAMAAAEGESQSYPEHEHDYKVETSICSTTETWCTLANIACWARHFHAPDKQGGYDSPAENGDEAVLTGPLGGDNPIRVGVGTAAGLPENAIGQITQDGHVFHNDEMAGWPTCPQTVSQQGNGTPPPACNQVYREPYTQNGQISMRTRGTGENNYDWANDLFGPGTFEELDEDMIEAILNKADRLCPSL